MWNAGYDHGEYQNGYGYHDEVNSYTQDSRYSDFYHQQQQPTYQMSYQQSGYQKPYSTPQQPTYQQNPCPNYYQPTFQEPYFTSSDQHDPPQHQDQQNDDIAELKDMMQQYMANMQRMSEEQNRHQAKLTQMIEESKIRQTKVAQLLAYNEMMDNTFDPPVASDPDHMEVLHTDIEVEVFSDDESTNEESKQAESHPEQEIRSNYTQSDRISIRRKTVDVQLSKFDRATTNPIRFYGTRSDYALSDRIDIDLQAECSSHPRFDRIHSNSIGLDQDQSNSPAFDQIRDPLVDSTCSDSREDGLDSYEAKTKQVENTGQEAHPKETIDDAVEDTWPEYLIKDPLEALSCLESCGDAVDTESIFVNVLEVALYGEELTKELSAIVHELIRTSEAHNSATKIIEPEPPSEESTHHVELSSSVTCIDHEFEQSERTNEEQSIEESPLVQHTKDQQLLVVDQDSVGLSNKRKLVLPCTTTDSETPLLERQSSTIKHLLGKEPVWGRKKKKIFELTGEGDYGSYRRENVVSEVECDPVLAGNYLGRSYGGFRDQFYIDPGSSSTGGFWSRNDFYGPWFND